MLPPQAIHWSTLINYIIQVYFTDSLTVCLLWNKDIEFNLGSLPTEHTQNAFLSIKRPELRESFNSDVFNFSALEQKFEYRELQYDDLVLKLTAAIQDAFCEAYVVFQGEIPIFVKAFRKAASYSNWRLRRVKFLFAFYKDEQKEPYFDDGFFAGEWWSGGVVEVFRSIFRTFRKELSTTDQPNVVVVEAKSRNSATFELKTNKFVGSRYENPEQFYTINTFDAVGGVFSNDRELFFNKLKNLEGREIVMAAFDYRPLVVLDYEMMPQHYDHANDNPEHKVFIDGTEVQVLLHFCALYNCKVEVDTTEKGDWGMVYANGSGEGLMGMILDGNADIVLTGLYLLNTDYIDCTNTFGRSGVSCLVPRPKRKSSWIMLLRPFQLTMWLGVSLCIIAEITSLFAVRHAELNLANANEPWSENFQFGFSTALRLLVSQCSHEVVSTPALRMILVACYMIDLVIESVYNGGLAAILTIPTFTEAADSSERLSRHNLIWTSTSDYWIGTIAHDTNPIIRNIYKNFRVHSYEDMREFAKTEDMGFAVERLTFDHFGNGEYLTQEALSRLKLMQDDIYFLYTYPLVPRLWCFLEKYNELIDKWHAFGFEKYWEWKIVADYIGVKQQEQVVSSRFIQIDDVPVKLGLDNFAGLVLVWMIGISNYVTLIEKA